MPIPGTQSVTAKLAPTSFLDTYATHEDIFGQGGYRAVLNEAQRDLIPDPRRKEGMVVYCQNERRTYKLIGGITNLHWILQPEPSQGIASNYAQLALIPTVDLLIGTTYITSDDGREYWWDGDDWFPVNTGAYHVALNLAEINTLPSHLKRDGEVWFSQTDRKFYQFDGIVPERVDPWYVSTQAEIFDAVAAPSRPHIILRKDIALTASLVIPSECSIDCNGYRFIKAGSGFTLTINGNVLDGRVQIFEQTVIPVAPGVAPTIVGWSYGDVRGSFGGKQILPEWWGLYGNTVDDGYHDVAINCAIQSCDMISGRIPINFPVDGNPGGDGHWTGIYNVTTPIHANVISLANRIYYCSAPCDLTSTLSEIHGEAVGASRITLTKNFRQDLYIGGNFWANDRVYRDNMYVAAIWIGGNGDNYTLARDTSGPDTGTWTFVHRPNSGDFWGNYSRQSFRNSVQNVVISVYEASAVARDFEIANPGEIRRVACISSKGWIEENTRITNVVCSYYSAFGIGSNGCRNFGNNSNPNFIENVVINGLEVNHAWITGATSKHAPGIYDPINSIRAQYRNLTISSVTDKANSASASVATYHTNYFMLGDRPLAIDGNKITIGSRTYTLVNTGSVNASPPDYIAGSGGAGLQTMLAALMFAINDGTTANYVSPGTDPHADVDAFIPGNPGWTDSIGYGNFVKIQHKTAGATSPIQCQFTEADGITPAIEGRWNSAITYGGQDATAAPKIPLCLSFAALVLEGNNTTVENVHIEAHIIGALCSNWNSEGHISITNINCFEMVDYGITYLTNNPDRIPGFPPPVDRAGGRDQRQQDILDGLDPNARTYIWKWSSAVVIAKRPVPDYHFYEFRGDQNIKGRVTLTGIRTNGSSKYLLRDAGYGNHILSNGQSQFPSSQTSCLAFYSRGNQWSLTPESYVNISGTDYLNTSPHPMNFGVSGTNYYQSLEAGGVLPTDKTYFIGPIY